MLRLPHSRRAGLTSVLCCLLVLLPVTSVRAMSALFLSMAPIETKSPATEEGESEELVHQRTSCRRTAMMRCQRVLECSRRRLFRDAAAAAACEATGRCDASEHGLRNGLGSPLRC